MDEKTGIMVALGTAIGANCIPCFDHIYSKAKEAGISDDEIGAAIRIANKVKTGASGALSAAIIEIMGTTEEQSGCGANSGCSCS